MERFYDFEDEIFLRGEEFVTPFPESTVGTGEECAGKSVSRKFSTNEIRYGYFPYK